MRSPPASANRMGNPASTAPTRELVVQVVEAVKKLTKYMNVTTVGVFGGVNINTQAKEVEMGVDVLVATPGRLFDLIMNGSIKTKTIKRLVIDEIAQKQAPA